MASSTSKVRAAQGEAGAQFTLLRSEMSTVKGKLSNLENGAQELSKYAKNHDAALAHHGTVIAALEKRLKAVEAKPVPARKRTKTGVRRCDCRPWKSSQVQWTSFENLNILDTQHRCDDRHAQ